MNESILDVAIVGASLGGASAALHLARSGASVGLFDKSQFPRRKVCGEGLSIQGLKELDLLGLAASVRALPHSPFYGFRFFEEGRRSEILLQPHLHGIGISRYLLDSVLLDACKASDVDVHVGAEVRVDKDSVSGFTLRADGRVIRPRYIILATGALSSLPQALGVPSFETKRSRCGFSVPLRHAKPHRQETVDIFIDPDIQACLTPVDETTTTLSLFCSNRRAYRLRPEHRPDLLREVCDRLNVQPLELEPPINISGLGRTYRKSVQGPVFVIGDALRQLDPIGGMGMTQALVSGRIAAETITSLLRSPSKLHSEIVATHEARIQQHTRALAGYTSLTYWSLSTPLGRKTLGRQKVGGLAREVLLSMHRPSLPRTPSGVLSTLLVQLAGLW